METTREQRSFGDYTYFIVMAVICLCVMLLVPWFRLALGLGQVPASATGMVLEAGWLGLWGWFAGRHLRRAWHCLWGWLE